MKIRKAKRREFRKIAKIYQDGFNEEPYNEKSTFKDSVKKIKVLSRYCDIWILILDKKIAGFLIINPFQWELGKNIFGEDICVAKEFRKKNVATKLLNFAFDYYKKKGYENFIGIINKDAKSFGFIKKFKMNISKNNLFVEKKLK